MTTPSVNPSLLAMRYVNALLSAAEKQGGFEVIRPEIITFLSMIEGSADLRRVLTSPALPARAGVPALRAVMTAAGLGNLLIGFCTQVVRNRRGRSLADFLVLTLAEMARRGGTTRVDVRVAEALSDAQARQVHEKLSAQTGGAVDMQVSVDPALIGGMIVRMGSVQVDDSVAGKLDRLKQSLRVAHAAA